MGESKEGEEEESKGKRGEGAFQTVTHTEDTLEDVM